MKLLLFHHALGVTPGIEAFAQELRAAGHTVDVPDLFDGSRFESIDDGVAHAGSIGFDVVTERGVAAASNIDGPYAVIGISLGVLPAQKLAQTDPRVVGAVLCSAAVPVSMFGGEWRARTAVEVHLGASDPWAEEDLEAARELATLSGGTLHLHETDRHLFLDSSHDDHDAELAGAVTAQIVSFLGDLETGD